jgi:hypothetical protein
MTNRNPAKGDVAKRETGGLVSENEAVLDRSLAALDAALITSTAMWPGSGSGRFQMPPLHLPDLAPLYGQVESIAATVTRQGSGGGVAAKFRSAVLLNEQRDVNLALLQGLRLVIEQLDALRVLEKLGEGVRLELDHVITQAKMVLAQRDEAVQYPEARIDSVESGLRALEVRFDERMKRLERGLRSS